MVFFFFVFLTQSSPFLYSSFTGTPSADAISGMYSAIIAFLSVNIALNALGENPAFSATAHCLSPFKRISRLMLLIIIWLLLTWSFSLLSSRFLVLMLYYY
nr:MAG TPA: hypothetical protein [Caudoviricetes sp.]